MDHTTRHLLLLETLIHSLKRQDQLSEYDVRVINALRLGLLEKVITAEGEDSAAKQEKVGERIGAELSAFLIQELDAKQIQRYWHLMLGLCNGIRTRFETDTKIRITTKQRDKQRIAEAEETRKQKPKKRGREKMTPQEKMIAGFMKALKCDRATAEKMFSEMNGD